MGKKGKNYTPNEMRSITMNPNNPAYKSKMDNRSNQLNPNHPDCKSDSKEEED